LALLQLAAVDFLYSCFKIIHKIHILNANPQFMVLKIGAISKGIFPDL